MTSVTTGLDLTLMIAIIAFGPAIILSRIEGAATLLRGAHVVNRIRPHSTKTYHRRRTGKPPQAIRTTIRAVSETLVPQVWMSVQDSHCDEDTVRTG
jgi:trehalose-6-phosphate synthase